MSKYEAADWAFRHVVLVIVAMWATRRLFIEVRRAWREYREHDAKIT